MANFINSPRFEFLTPSPEWANTPHPPIYILFHATMRLALRERLLDLVTLQVRVGVAVRLRVRVLVGDALATA